MGLVAVLRQARVDVCLWKYGLGPCRQKLCSWGFVVIAAAAAAVVIAAADRGIGGFLVDGFTFIPCRASEPRLVPVDGEGDRLQVHHSREGLRDTGQDLASEGAGGTGEEPAQSNLG